MTPVALLKQVRRIQLQARRRVQTHLAGDYHSAFKGSGLSYDDVREYQPGDDIRQIDWNVTARAGKPYLKRFVEERELIVLIAVDLSGSLQFGSTPLTKRRVAAEIAALIALAALHNGDRVGFLGFTDRIERYQAPARGPHQAARLIRDILMLQPISMQTDLAAACREIRRVQPRRSLVFLISDFLAAGYESPLKQAARQHDLCAVVVRDRYEAEFPKLGLLRVQDSETGQVRIVDTNRLPRTEAFQPSQLHRCGADVIMADTNGDHLDAVVEFFQRRSQAR